MFTLKEVYRFIEYPFRIFKVNSSSYSFFNKSIKTIAQVTLLPEALNTFKATIPAGKTVQTVLVFEMTETNANNLTSIVLDIKSSKGTNSVNIK